MYLLDLRGGYLYQHKPSVFPGGEISGTELLLWDFYYQQKKSSSTKR